MSPYNPEASYLRTYLDWIIELPWGISSPNNVNTTEAHAVLDEDHYGLQKMKERILEYLAVMKLRSLMVEETKEESVVDEKNKGKEPRLEGKEKGKSAPTILCFVGPPGSREDIYR